MVLSRRWWCCLRDGAVQGGGLGGVLSRGWRCCLGLLSRAAVWGRVQEGEGWCCPGGGAVCCLGEGVVLSITGIDIITPPSPCEQNDRQV